jgi:hypothetical protein
MAPGLLDHEDEEQQDPGPDDLRDGDKSADGPPVVALALDEAEDHPQETARCQKHTEQVELVPAPGPKIRHQEESEEECRESNRDVDVEDRRPAKVGDQEAAERPTGEDRQPRTP